MWQENPIRNSKYHYINRFDLIIAIAKVMRGNHFYYVSAENQALYAVPEEPYAIREVLLPPELHQDTSFLFRLDMVDPELVNRHLNFVLFDAVPWALIPSINLDDAHDYAPFYRPVSDTKIWTIVNTLNKAEVEHVDLYGPDGSKSAMLPNVMSTFQSFFNTRQYVSLDKYVFPNMERSIIVQDVFANKASMGEKYLDLRYNNMSFGFFLFKNLFSFNKNDLLTIEARKRVDNNKIFELKFTVTHDKNNVKYIIPGDFIESTYVVFACI